MNSRTGKEEALSVVRNARVGDVLHLRPGRGPAWVRLTGVGPAGSVFGEAPNGAPTQVRWQDFGRLEEGAVRGALVAAPGRSRCGLAGRRPASCPSLKEEARERHAAAMGR